ncbi:MAG: 50S ribosomal protein L38e [Candidatus Bathyarchaeia archaeon]
MPSEVFDKDLFVKLADRASHCRVVRKDGQVKLKLRTVGRLYTIRLDSAEAETLIKELKCKVYDLSKEKK